MSSSDASLEDAINKWFQGSMDSGGSADFRKHWCRDMAVVKWARTRAGDYRAASESNLDATAFNEWLYADPGEHFDICHHSAEAAFADIRRSDERTGRVQACGRQRYFLITGLIHALRAAEQAATLLKASFDHNGRAANVRPNEQLIADARASIVAYGMAWRISQDSIEKSSPVDRPDPVDNILQRLTCEEQLFSDICTTSRSITAPFGDNQPAPSELSTCGWLMFRHVVLDLLQSFETDRRPRLKPDFETEVRLLLVQQTGQNQYKGHTCPLEVRLEDTGVAGVIVDPLSMGLTVIEDSMLNSLRNAWAAVQSHITDQDNKFGNETSLQTHAVRLSPQSFTEYVDYMSDDSAGGIFAAGIYAALTKTELNPRATASCRLGDDDSLTLHSVSDDTLHSKFEAALRDHIFIIALEERQAERNSDLVRSIGHHKLRLCPAVTVPDLLRCVSKRVGNERFIVEGSTRKIKGRTAELRELHDALNQDVTAGVPVQVAVTGIGGIGKTELAIAYCWNYGDEWPGGVFFLHAELGPESELLRVARRFGIPTSHADVAINKLFSLLRSRTDFLIVVDNINDRSVWKQWREFLKDDLPERRLLITTQHSSLSDEVTTLPELRRLQHSYAVDVLSEWRPDAGDPEHRSAVNDLVEWVECMPLALTVVGLYMAAHPELGWRDYLQHLVDSPASAIDETDPEERPGSRYEKRLWTVFDEYFASLSPPERRALQYASLLPADRILPKWLFDLVADDNELLELAEHAGRKSIEDQLAGLLKSDVLRPGPENCYSLHRVLSARIQTSLSNKADDLASSISSHAADWIDTAMETWKSSNRLAPDCSTLASIVPSLEGDFESKATRINLVVQALISFNRLNDYLDMTVALQVANADDSMRFPYEIAAAGPLLLMGKLNEAASVIERAESSDHKPQLHPWTALDLTMLQAIVRLHLGQLSEAVKLAEQVLSMAQSTPELPKINAASAATVASGCFLSFGNVARAVETGRLGVALLEQEFSPQHVVVSISRITYAGALRAKGELKAAEESFKSVITGLSDIDPHHPLLVPVHNQLGTLLIDSGRFRNGLCEYKKATEISELLFDESHPTVAASFSNLGMAHLKLGDLHKALECTQQSISLDERYRGPIYANLSVSYGNAGLILTELGQGVESPPMYRRSLEVAESNYDAMSDHVASAVNNYGMAEWENGGDIHGVLTQLRRARDIMVHNFGGPHPRLVVLSSNIAMLLNDIGDTDDALQAIDDAIEMAQRCYQDENPDWSRLWFVKAQLLYNADKIESAHKWAEKAVEKDRQCPSSDLPDTSPSHRTALLAQILFRQKDYEGAIRLSEETVAIKQRDGSGSPKERVEVYSIFARALWKQQRHDEARSAILVVDRITESEIDPDVCTANGVARCLSVAEVCQECEMPELAAKWVGRVETVPSASFHTDEFKTLEISHRGLLVFSARYDTEHPLCRVFSKNAWELSESRFELPEQSRERSFDCFPSWLQVAIGLLYAIQTDRHQDRYPAVGNLLRTQLQRIRDQAGEAVIQGESSQTQQLSALELGNNAAWLLARLWPLAQESGYAAEAQAWLKEITEFYQTLPTRQQNHIEAASQYFEYAMSLWTNDEFSEARDYAEAAVNIYEHIASAENSSICAQCRRWSHRVWSAVVRLGRVLSFRLLPVGVCGCDRDGGVCVRLSLATGLKLLGRILYDTSQIDEAVDIQTRCIAIEEKVRARGDLELAASYQILAMTLLKADRCQEARKYAERVIRMYEKQSGPDDPFLAGTYGILAKILCSLGHLSLAKERVNAAIRNDNLNLPEDDSGRYARIEILGEIEWSQGNRERATEWFELALEGYQRTLDAQDRPLKRLLTKMQGYGIRE